MSFDKSKIFDNIYRKGLWDPVSKKDGTSGPGSDPKNANEYIVLLQALINILSIRSIVDLGCGDFQIMSQINLGPVQYMGVDVSRVIVERNRRHQKKNITFFQGDLVDFDYPFCDLIILKEVLQHLPNSDVISLFNKARNKARYILITEDTGGDRENTEIIPGDWRPINFTKPPFNFPLSPIMKFGKHNNKQVWVYRSNNPRGEPRAAFKISLAALLALVVIYLILILRFLRRGKVIK